MGLYLYNRLGYDGKGIAFASLITGLRIAGAKMDTRPYTHEPIGAFLGSSGSQTSMLYVLSVSGQRQMPCPVSILRRNFERQNPQGWMSSIHKHGPGMPATLWTRAGRIFRSCLSFCFSLLLQGGTTQYSARGTIQHQLAMHGYPPPQLQDRNETPARLLVLILETERMIAC
jgi:hypothetical protein